jgi:hypothetical protein
MTDAPERIGVWQEEGETHWVHGRWGGPAGGTQYVRADLYDALEASLKAAEARADALADDLDALRRTVVPISKLRKERDALAEKLERAVEAAEMFGGPDWAAKMDYDSGPLAAIQETPTDD